VFLKSTHLCTRNTLTRVLFRFSHVSSFMLGYIKHWYSDLTVWSKGLLLKWMEGKVIKQYRAQVSKLNV